jgi:tungstate transport system substrate-binding protein
LLSLRKTIFAFIAVFGSFLAGQAIAQEKSIVVASTTSTVDSGLFDYLLPIFTHKTGIAVNVLELGTGQALDAGRRGEADVVFVHAKIPEMQFVIEGHGVKRFPVMYNDFVLVGPKSDPAGIKGMDDVAKAFRTIKDKHATFISRGDRSGTHLAELAIWYRDVGIDIDNEKGPWYRSVRQNMDKTLGEACVNKGYVLSDRSTWIHFKNKSDLQILVEGDRRMFNQYTAILVNPGKHPNVKRELGQAFIDWVVSSEGQRAIANYKINGEQLFFPNATDPKA